jgi:glucose-1-phosphate adenylyltransferase
LLNKYPDDKDFGKDIIPKSIGTHKVFSYQYEGYWEDIGQISSFFEANLALTNELPPFNLYDNIHTIFTRPRMLPPTKISGTTLERTMIAEGSFINASRIEHSVIGIRSRIGFGTTIVSSYLMGNDQFETLQQMEMNLRKGIPKVGIGERCFIKHAIVDKNCRIGNDVRIVGGTGMAETDNPLYTIKDDIVVVKKNAILPDGFVIQ